MIDPRVLRDDPDRVRAAQERGLSATSSTRRSRPTRPDARRSWSSRPAGRAEGARQADPEGAGRGEAGSCSRAPRRCPPTSRRPRPRRPRPRRSYQRGADERSRTSPPTRRPAGGEDDYVVLEHVGEPRDFAAEGFEPRDHVELGRILGAIDIDRGAKVSGARFYYLTGAGADLELALVNMAMDQARAAGFTTVIPPALVRPRAMEGTGFLGQAADDVYRIEGEDLYLVGTSEVPLAAYHSDEILDGRDAAAALRGVQPLLPQGGRLLRQGHPRHHPGALVRQGGDVQLHDRRGVVRRAPAAARVGEGVPRQARAGVPGHRRRRRRPRAVGGAEVRLRGVDPDPGPLPRADLDLELHRLPGPPARHPRPLRGRHGARWRRSTARCAR